ncbi:MAG: Oxygen-independent coproporphyrinogen-III oxidase 1 [Bacteroidetes bacterium ADurb.Bin408]|nr:MAG: Oxygen-independent coproporphyrinogen-III oxidase 1 [Bacteroidetes bacterium ADurb.Bin408]
MTRPVYCLLVSPVFNPGKDNLLMMVREQDPPLNLAMLAAWVRQKGFDVSIFDAALEAPTPSQYQKKLEVLKEKYKDTQLYIGFYICTPTAYNCYELARISRAVFPDAVLMAGGPHASFMYQEVLTLSPIDVAVIGEGEITLQELLEGKAWHEIKGLSYKADNQIKVTPPRERITAIDSLPMPAYDLLNVRRYRPPIGTFKRWPSFMVTFSRGCPNQCFFCTKTLGVHHYQKSAAHMSEEIIYLNRTFGVKDFVFVDDTFTSNRQNVVDFCNLIIQKKLDISWHSYTRVNAVDEDLLAIMKQAGCHQLMYGIESFSKDVLAQINKEITTTQIETAIRLTKRAGITCRLALMVGNKGDTHESLRYSIREMMRLKPDFISVLIATPGPGTPFFAWAEKENRFISKDWKLYTGSTPVVRLDDLSPADIKYYYRLFWKKFYFSPRVMFKLLRKTTSIYQLYNLWMGFWKVITFIFIRRK